MSRGFDRIAPYYDSLARLVFGESIRRCQLKYLDKIPPEANVLILGGGTGWLLEELLKINPGCIVWYVESSVKMIDIARARVHGVSTQRVRFIHGTEKSLEQYPDMQFDAVITNFYFDLFTSASLNAALKDLGKRLRDDGVLLVCEFIDERRWMRLLLFLMYSFFRSIGAIETTSLPDWQHQLIQQGFEDSGSSSFYFGFIHSRVYVLSNK